MTETEFATYLRNQRTLSQQDVDKIEREHDKDNYRPSERLAY